MDRCVNDINLGVVEQIKATVYPVDHDHSCDPNERAQVELYPVLSDIVGGSVDCVHIVIVRILNPVALTVLIGCFRRLYFYLECWRKVRDYYFVIRP